MRDHRANPKQGRDTAALSRRDLLAAGAGLIAAPTLAASARANVDRGPISARAYGAASATAPLGPLQDDRSSTHLGRNLPNLRIKLVRESFIGRARQKFP